jgi:hypothetical protein
MSARVCPFKTRRSLKTIRNTRLRTRRCDCSFVVTYLTVNSQKVFRLPSAMFLLCKLLLTRYLLSVLCCPNSDGTPNTSPAGTRLAVSGGIPRGMRTVFFVLVGILCLSECGRFSIISERPLQCRRCGESRKFQSACRDDQVEHFPGHPSPSTSRCMCPFR